MNTNIKTAKGIILIIICLFLTACSQINDISVQPPEAIEGVIDLREWDFERDGSINLSGEWAFFWGELLQPDQITNLNQAPYVVIPDIWTNYDIEGKTLEPEGYATYYLTLYPPYTDQAYGLYIEGEGSAYALWVDGRLLAQNGQVGTDPQAMTPEKKPITVFFEPDEETVEMVVQVSNYHHRKGGFRNSLLLGSAETIHQYQMQNWFIEAFSVGILFIMGLYHLVIYFFRTRNKATLYFALLCWIMAVRTGVTNQSTLLFHLPVLSWSVALRIEYLSFFLAPLPFVLFLKTLYPKDIHAWFVRAIVGSGIGFTLFLLFTDTLTLSYTSTYYQIVYILGIVYCLIFLGRIMIKRRTGAFYIGLASLIVFIAVIIETLILQNIVEALYITSFLPIGQISSFSFLAFIFVQSILLANLFSKSFTRVETLSVELEDTNLSLEQSERKYRTIFEDSNDMIFIAGLDGQIEDVSPVCEEVLGYTKRELMEMTLFDVIVNPADSDRFQKAIIDQGSVNNFETELQRKDKEVIHTLVSATSRLGENGKITGVQGDVRDITDRKQAEAERLRALEMQKSQERFRELSASTFESLFIHDNGMILDVNQTAEELFGYTQAELIGKHVIELMTAETRQIATQHIQTGYEKPYELTGLRKDGAVFPLEVHAKTVAYQGRQARVVAARDITERVQAEEQMQQALQETEALLTAAKAILGATDLKGICHNLISHFNELVQADRTTLILLDQGRKQIQFAIVHGSIEGEISLSYEEVVAGISGIVLKSKQPMISLSADDGIEPEATQAYRTQNEAGPLIVVPLVTKTADGTSTVIGTTTAINLPGQREFTQRDADLLMALTTQAAAVIENVRLFEETQAASEAAEVANQALEIANAKLQELAITDPLTKSYNRRHFFDLAEKEFERAKRSNTSLSVIIFDIDHFKNVNDTYGHLIGDQVLIKLVNLCQRNIRSIDVFARFGGEEFVVLMPDTDSKSAQESAERLREMVAEKPMAVSGETGVPITISLGITHWDYKNPLEINILLDQADQALYHSKKAGRNRATIWKDTHLL